jgi:pimeloyl-ACP methyl ester carboxylesterase
MSTQQTLTSQPQVLSDLVGACGPAMDYAIDAAQRTVLFWDVLRQRGNQYREHMAETVPNVLNYEAELIIDGRTLKRPVNYGLVRIVPPQGIRIEARRRPFVIVDPRAGHGPGIGGFKADSEVGVIFKAGHPCYFVGFLPEPMPGQTIEDVARAEAIFLEKVISLHPDAEGKPGVIGNCQGGWAVMMLAAIRPELFGPIIIAGSPLSYWGGVHGKNPMRYSGGLLGGSWLTALTSDLGGGKFDGAWLVQNFENQNPANTLWTKQYNVYSKIDTEAPRYLGFERYWGGHVNLNAEEIQFIVDELFIGNNLAAGRIKTSDGMAVDLRNIRSPVVVFCSKGDNITPPQQALDWILDLYDDVDDIRSHGQTIVYTIHDKIGHLGIFVSGAVAKKEHGEFANNIDLIDTLPPGLYEAVFEPKTDTTAGADLIPGDWVMRCEMRTLDDIRALGGNDAADERRFATAARFSEVNLALYRTFARPVVRSFVSAPLVQMLLQMHPLRLQYQIFSNANPFMAPVAAMAEEVRKNRRPVAADNPFTALQENVSKQIVAALDRWRDFIEAVAERTFLTVYGSPALQAAAGIDPAIRCRLPNLIDQIRAIRDQSAGRDKEPFEVDRRQLVPRSKRNDQITMNDRRRARRRDDAAIRDARERRNGALDLAGVAHVDRAYLHSERWRHGLNDGELADPGRTGGIPKHSRSRHARPDLLEQFQPFPAQTVFEHNEAGSVAARPRQTIDEPGTDWIDDHREYDRDGAGCLEQRIHIHDANRQDDIGRKRHQFRRVFARVAGIAAGRAVVDAHVAALGPAQSLASRPSKPPPRFPSS